MAGVAGVGANHAHMTRRVRTQRTERILVARLEELALALERTGAPEDEVVRMLESASVATANAVALDLLTPEAADEIWRDAAERHPAVPLSRAA